MAVEIRPATEADVEALRAAVDAVARERRYLASLEAPPLEEMRERIRKDVERGVPRLVAVVEGAEPAVVGWCDVEPRARVGFEHVGGLGMGVLPGYRRRGIGSRLLEAALAAAREWGLEKIELGVFASNEAAIALYERHGFVHEGRRLKTRKIDGRYDDLVWMGLMFPLPQD